MNGAARIPKQADFDLERVIDLFDQALISKDERVINALRSLLMIVTLTAPEGENDIMDRRSGPFRQLQQDMNDMWRRISDLEEQNRKNAKVWPQGTDPYSNPWANPWAPPSTNVPGSYPSTTATPHWTSTTTDLGHLTRMLDDAKISKEEK